MTKREKDELLMLIRALRDELDRDCPPGVKTHFPNPFLRKVDDSIWMLCESRDGMPYERPVCKL